MAALTIDWLSLLGGAVIGAVAVAIYRFPLEFVRGFGREAGKNLATRQDIESALDRLERSAQVTENIKTWFASGEWNRQRIFEQKRDIYRACIEELGNSVHNLGELSECHLIRSCGRTVDKAKFDEAYRVSNSTRMRLKTQAALASIFLSAEAAGAMREACAGRPVDGMSSDAIEHDWCRREIEILELTLVTILRAAKSELGVNL